MGVEREHAVRAADHLAMAEVNAIEGTHSHTSLSALRVSQPSDPHGWEAYVTTALGAHARRRERAHRSALRRREPSRCYAAAAPPRRCRGAAGGPRPSRRTDRSPYV